METLTAIAGVALGLTSVASQSGISSKYKPLLSLIFGIIYANILSGLSMEAVGLGIVGGLMASGLYSGSKTILTKDNVELSTSSEV